MAAWVSVYTAACMSIGTPDRGPLLHPTWCNAKHKPRVSPPPRPSCGTSPEGQHGQGAVGLVAGVTAQPAAPEVMMPQVPQRRLCAEVLRATQQTAGSGLCPPPGWKPSLPHVSHQSWVQPRAPSHPAPAGSPRGSTVPCSVRSPSDLSHPLREPHPFQDQADILRGHHSWGCSGPSAALRWHVSQTLALLLVSGPQMAPAATCPKTGLCPDGHPSAPQSSAPPARHISATGLRRSGIDAILFLGGPEHPRPFFTVPVSREVYSHVMLSAPLRWGSSRPGQPRVWGECTEGV